MAKAPVAKGDSSGSDALRRELVEHFRKVREPLRKNWVELMTAKGLLAGLSPKEIETESMTIYDTCVNCLATVATQMPNSTQEGWPAAASSRA